MTNQTIPCPAVAVADSLTRLTGVTWVGGQPEGEREGNWYVTRTADNLKLQVYGHNRTSTGDVWSISLSLWTGPGSNSKNYAGDRLPYFSSKERAAEAGKPWGKVDGKCAGGSINVSKDKAAVQIAKDITSRLLPLADPAWVHILASLADSNAYHELAGALADDLAALAGTVATHNDNGHRVDLSKMCVGFGKSGKINVYGDSVNIELRSLTPDEARAVVRALAALKVGA